MKLMKYIFLLLAFSLCSGVVGATASFQNENLKYVISYKWGMIHKDTGDATLSLRKDGNIYNVMLAAKTRPWADKLFMVRDTLQATISVSDLKPLSYKKLTHEKDKYAKDVINYSYNGATTTGLCTRYRIKDGKWTTAQNTLTSNGPVYDMLSVFYYLRKLDYAQLNKNKVYVATVFSGKKKEKITIKSLGKETIKLKDNSQREAYHIKFNFTQEGGKKSSDDIDTWISTDSRHIPLYVVGKLPIGQMRAYYVGG